MSNYDSYNSTVHITVDYAKLNQLRGQQNINFIEALSKVGKICASESIAQFENMVKDLQTVNFTKVSALIPNAQIDIVNQMACLQAQVSAIKSDPVMYPTVNSICQPDLIDNITNNINLALKSMANGNFANTHDLVKIETEMTNAISKAKDYLMTWQHNYVLSAMTDVLPEIGYEELEIKSNHDSAAIFAKKDGSGLGIVVQQGGDMHIDTIGYDGEECEEERKKLIEKLRNHGIELKNKVHIHHRRREGGNLISEARGIARQERCSAAEGLLKAVVKIDASIEHRRIQRNMCFYQQKILGGNKL